ncbi:MAG TPA: hypothetical protein VF260_11535 [Bacilli bacterium]
MNIHLNVSIGDEKVKEAVIHIENHKLEALSDDEIQQAVEIKIREWVNSQISIAWETSDDPVRIKQDEE